MPISVGFICLIAHTMQLQNLYSFLQMELCFYSSHYIFGLYCLISSVVSLCWLYCPILAITILLWLIDCFDWGRLLMILITLADRRIFLGIIMASSFFILFSIDIFLLRLILDYSDYHNLTFADYHLTVVIMIWLSSLTFFLLDLIASMSLSDYGIWFYIITCI